MNGTYVDGMRVFDELEVRPGDLVSFGAASYQLTRPRGSTFRTPRPSRSTATRAA
jgi:hypothetical protein